MKANAKFTLSSASTVLTPTSKGLAALLKCLSSGASIVANQSGENPIKARNTDQPFLFCETSGSGGSEKMIRRRPISWIQSFDLNRQTFGQNAKDNYATFGHIGHSLTLFAILEALHIGADISALSGLSPKAQIRNLLKTESTVIYATPSQLRLLALGATSAGIQTIETMRLVFIGGGKLDSVLLQSISALFPQAALREFFGASETSFISITDAKTPTASVGQAYPGVSIRIEHDLKTQPMQTGEIWVSSPYLFDGYEIGSSEDTIWNGNYLSIGEMGYLDAQGYLFLRGRKNRMVTIADKNVFPEEIENTLLQMPEIDFCAAIVQHDTMRGNKIICVVQSSSGKNAQKTLRKKCREILGAHTVPRQFVFMDELPLLPAGKPDLQALQRKLKEMD